MIHEYERVVVNSTSVCCAWGVAASVLLIVWMLSLV
jgi:hypothetical protein